MDAIIKRFPDNRAEGAPERPSREEAEAAVEVLIRWAGDDPAREGLRETPARVVKSYDELFGGYRTDPAAILGRVFEEVGGYKDAVVVRDIDFHSHCEHHMVPIIGKAHVAYLPSGPVLGLSKIGRVVDVYARRLQTQEKMTVQIATAIEAALKPKGVAVVLEAEHLCMAMRGIRTKGSTTLTSVFHGVFADDQNERDRILAMMRVSA